MEIREIRLLFLLTLQIAWLPAPGQSGDVLLRMAPTETQLTHGAKGHMLNNAQVFSPDDSWIVYDTRNLDTQLGQTCCIEMVHVATGETRLLYQVPNQTEYGPGVGAATFCPTKPAVLFLHGLRNASVQQPYAMTRRTGVLVNINQPRKPRFLDGRNTVSPFTPGALRGGTHAHQWSADGELVSFTYNDAVLEQLSHTDSSKRDLRTVGVMAPIHRVSVGNSNDADTFDGEWFASVIATVTEQPKPGSDDIDKAFDETWIGSNGYQKTDGGRQKRALAFQGNVRNGANQTITQVFVLDLPDDLTNPAPNQPLEGTTTTRPNPPAGMKQRRVTFIERGIEGPRHWLRTTPDGTLIGFLAKDPAGLIQLFGVAPTGGAVRQLTYQPFPIQTPFNFSPDGQRIAYAADNSVFITDVKTGKSQRMTSRSSDDARPINGVIWSNKGDRVVYNRYVNSSQGRYIQIFQLLCPAD